MTACITPCSAGVMLCCPQARQGRAGEPSLATVLDRVERQEAPLGRMLVVGALDDLYA
jgi:hypothetical protein